MKTLHAILLTIILISTSVLSAQSWGKHERIKGNGEMTTINRTTADYEAVSCSGFMDFKLVKGTEGNITLNGESNLLPYIITEVKNGTLYIKIEKNKSLLTSRNKSILITIPFQNISKVSLAGSGDLWNDDLIEASNFRTNLTGSGDITLHVSSSRINAHVTGSGDLNLEGNTTELSLKLTGSGDINSEKLEAENVEAKVTGSGDIALFCKGTLTARVSGSGDIQYIGNPSSTDSKILGSGSISN